MENIAYSGTWRNAGTARICYGGKRDALCVAFRHCGDGDGEFSVLVVIADRMFRKGE